MTLTASSAAFSKIRTDTMQKITVHKEGSPLYDIELTDSFDGIIEHAEDLKIYKRRICIVTDSNVGNNYLLKVKELFSGALKCVSYVFPAGEESKQLSTVAGLYRLLIEERFDRRDLLVALGGGVTGDLTGFAAATFLRGVDFIQMPTSLLSCVDSSIGGKTGVDLEAYKNMVGAFYMPKLVYINVNALKTLTDREFSSGMGEVIKHALIADAGYYEFIEENIRSIMARDTILSDVIKRSIEIKRAVVEVDPYEKGIRAILNFGHTVGHAIEKESCFTLTHGHCVALGCVCAAYISAKRGYITEAELKRTEDLFKEAGLPVRLHIEDAGRILELTKSDKKMAGGHIRFILLKSIGEAFICEDVSDDEIMQGIEYIRI